jgi:hypothetical protein
MTTDDEVNAFFSRKARRNPAGAKKVYDLDSTPLDVDIKLAAWTIPVRVARHTDETSRGVVLCGYDSVGDAVADFNSVRDRANPEHMPSEMLPATIELPAEDLLAGENGIGVIRLLQPSQTDTVVIMRSANPIIADVPETVVIEAGETFAQFPITTSNPGRATASVLIQAMLPGDTLYARRISVRYNLGLKVR